MTGGAAAAAAGAEAAITGSATTLSVACTTSGLSGSALRLRDAPPSAFWRNFFDAAIIALENRERDCQPPHKVQAASNKHGLSPVKDLKQSIWVFLGRVDCTMRVCVIKAVALAKILAKLLLEKAKLCLQRVER